MQTLKISSLEELYTVILGLRNPFYQLQFRGEVCDDCNWLLLPSVARGLKTPQQLIEKEKYFLDQFLERLDQKDLGYRILEQKNPTLFQTDWERLAQAQHYGLPTRLMDWSLDKDRAIYFAVDNDKMDGHDGRLWIYNCPDGGIYGDWKDNPASSYLQFDPFRMTNPIIANPAYYYYKNHQDYIGNERRFKQMGRFLVQSAADSIVPMDQNKLFAEELVKVIIPAGLKKSIRDYYHNDTGLNKDFLYGEKDEDIDAIITDLKRF